MIRPILLASGLVLVSTLQALHAQTVTNLLANGDAANRVDIALVGDGYTTADRAKFDLDTTAFVQRVLAQSPYSQYKGLLNVRSVFVASTQSGADHSDRTPQVFRDTAFDAAYNCSSIQRLICVSTTKVNAALAQVLSPNQRDIVVVLVNDTEYGGSGGAVAVTSLHSDATEIVLHELGHSFGLLADEYTDNPPVCSLVFEPSTANATLASTRAGAKWAAWIANSTAVPTSGTTLSVPGLYQGADYCATGKYRPTYDSKMRSLGRSFDQINTEQLIKRIYNLVSPIDSVTPAATAVTLVSLESRVFTVTSPVVTTGLTYVWRLDGVVVGTNSASYTVVANNLSAGAHTLRVNISDPTTLVRTDPGALLTDLFQWALTAPAPVAQNPVTMINAASLQSGTLAPDSFAAAKGTGLASGTAAAGLTSTVIPYPTNFGGTTVSVRDSAGVDRLASIYYVSATQINYVLPATMAAGAATVTITPATGVPSVGQINVAPVAPGVIMFGGTDLAAAVVIRSRNGVQTAENVYAQNASGAIVAAPIDLGPSTDVVSLLFFGTGLRNRTALNKVTLTVAGTPVTVEYAGAQSQYPGLDQINITLPRTFIGRGDVVVQVTVDGLAANPVHLNIR